MRFVLHIILLVLVTFSAAFAQKVPSDTTKKVEINTDKLPPYRKDRRGDPYSRFNSPSPLLLKEPSGYKTKIELDTSGQYYNIEEKIGNIDYREPSRLELKEYKEYRFKQDLKSYTKKKGFEQERGAIQDTSKNRQSGKLIPDIPLSPIFNRIFGGDKIEFRPTGSVLLDFGGLWQRVDNPQIPVAQQRVGGFNFDQQIQMSLTGQIGTKFSITTNFDTKNMFQFDQRYNFTYSAFEQDIIQEIQVGNVNFNTSNSLIKGAQNLFGVRTKLRFGKLFINNVLASKRGTSESITIRNGSQGREFEIRASTYDENRHFFLAHFFRDNYEKSLATLPNVASGVVITRVEVYITNRALVTDKQRNIAAFLDMGEDTVKSYRKIGMVQQNPNPNFRFVADNAINTLFAKITDNQAFRNPDLIVNSLQNNGDDSLRSGTDFELLRRARQLIPNTEYTFHPLLGYISLKTPIREDEILAVSFEYTYNGQKYKVGEMTEDYQQRSDSEVIFLKMLKPASVRVDLPSFDLMMKNIYSLNTIGLKKDNFQLRIIYRDDNTGVDNPSLHEGENLKNIPLVEVVGIDKLNPNGDPAPDGNFDYIPGITINEADGLIAFTTLEPFGSTISNKFKVPEELNLIQKYSYNELYRTTRAQAVLNTTNNKYVLKGSFQTGSGNEIKLPGINIAPRSVIITAGGMTLAEGKDYTVDYNFGTVRITNEGVMQSGKEIRIQYERADMFSFQTRNLVGFDAEYRFNKNFKLSSTLMYLNERPIISRVSIGSEPTSNVLWGFGLEHRAESQLITKIIDKLPGISTKQPSSIATKLEFAQIIPGTPQLLGEQEGGRSYIDDFEAAEISYDYTRSPLQWFYGSVPQFIKNLNPVPTDNPLSYNYRRARLAWYNIDNVFYSTGGSAQRPSNIDDEYLQNHYVRAIPFNEVYPNRQRGQIITNDISFDLAYYPNERGPYNYNPDLNPDGTLNNPRQNFAAITRAMNNQNVDFDNTNIQYVEFWLMDPFIQGTKGQILGKLPNGQPFAVNNTTGGDMYLQLGIISEDAIPDNKVMFENGIAPGTTAETPYGNVPTVQYLTNAFDANVARNIQDVGIDGLSNAQEYDKFLNNYLTKLNPQAFSFIQNDPSADDFKYYLGGDLDRADAKILERYKYYNGYENNSPELQGGAAFPASSSSIPDNEDLNRDNNLETTERYYQIKIPIRPGLDVGDKYITNKIPHVIEGTSEVVNWYQFRVPIRGNDVENIGNITGYKTIKHLRIVLHNWAEPVVMRMIGFQLVGAQWRPYTVNPNDPASSTTLPEPGINTPSEPTGDGVIRISTVNLEENGVSYGENIPYTLPPGTVRDFDATSQVTRQQNEQSLQICVDNLADRAAKAVYKNIVLDMVQYKRIKMFIHAQSPNNSTADREVTAFLRFGTDFTQNYYEIEVPLLITPRGSTNEFAIWPQENNIDIAFEDLYLVKAKRNQQGRSLNLRFADTVGRYIVSIVGRPDLSSVQTVMIGVRNPASVDGAAKTFCIWVNELRVTDFNNTAGWAANASVNMQLADLATVSTNVRYSTVGFGDLQDKPAQRQRSENLDFDISSTVALDKFFLNKIGITLPMFVSYQRSTRKPYFDPLDPDVPLDISVMARNENEREAYRNTVMDFSETRSINFSGIKKKKMKEGAASYPWDIENLTLSLSYSDQKRRDIRTQEYLLQQWKVSAGYAYSPKIKPIEPFVKSENKFINRQSMKWFKELNISLLPSSFTVRGDLDRRYVKTQLRSAQLVDGVTILSTTGIPAQYEKSFFFNRGYTMQWALTKSIGLDYNAQALAIIDEPTGDKTSAGYSDSVWKNIEKFGRMKSYSQNIGVNYKLPFDKIPGVDFLNGDVRYTAGYDWNAGPTGISDSLGNSLSNKNNISANGKVDLEKLYNKVPYLKRINEKQKAKGRSRTGTNPNIEVDDRFKRAKKRTDEKLERLEPRVKKQAAKITKRKEKQAKKQAVADSVAAVKLERFETHLKTLAENTKVKLDSQAAQNQRKEIQEIDKRTKIDYLNAKKRTERREKIQRQNVKLLADLAALAQIDSTVLNTVIDSTDKKALDKAKEKSLKIAAKKAKKQQKIQAKLDKIPPILQQIAAEDTAMTSLQRYQQKAEKDKQAKAAQKEKMNQKRQANTARREANFAKRLERVGKDKQNGAERAQKLSAANAAKNRKRFERERKRMARQEGVYLPPQDKVTKPPKPEKLTHLQKKQQRLTKKATALQEKIDFRKKNDIKPPEFKLVEGLISTVMSFKDFNLSYTETNSTSLPGYTPIPDYFGFDNQWNAPGLPFVLGSQNSDILQTAGDNNWLSRSTAQNTPFRQTTNKQISFRTQAEPIRDFKISFDARRNSTASYSEVFKFIPDANNPDGGEYVSQSPVRTGSYGTSFISIATAFTSGRDGATSPIFENFTEYRNTIRGRLNNANPLVGVNPNDSVEYGLGSQDVLIPSFLAAYSGRNPNTSSLSAFPAIPLPNWKVTYGGLSRLEFIKKRFNNVSITHGYTSNYDVGNYTSSLIYGPNDINLNVSETSLGLARTDAANPNSSLLPLLVIQQVSIREAFSPLIGVSFRTKKNVSFKLDYNRRRDMVLTLSNSQVTETYGNDVVIDLGYTKAGLKIPFLRTATGKTVVLTNDVTFRLAFTIRDTRTIQRVIDAPDRVTAGNVNIQFRPTISYVLNKRANMQFYFERSINEPVVSNAFPRYTTAFGLQFRFNLTQ